MEVAMEMSAHALARSKQRGIGPDIIELILGLGSGERRPGDAVEYRLNRRDRARMIGHLKRQIQVIEKAARKAVLVSNDGTIITTYNRLQG
jgi:hypothetical protein